MFQTQPKDATVLPGNNAVFSVVLANTFPGMSLTWFKDGVALINDATFSGTNTDTLAITGAANENEGSYNVAIVRSIGTVCFIISAPAMLTVCK